MKIENALSKCVRVCGGVTECVLAEIHSIDDINHTPRRPPLTFALTQCQLIMNSEEGSGVWGLGHLIDEKHDITISRCLVSLGNWQFAARAAMEIFFIKFSQLLDHQMEIKC